MIAFSRKGLPFDLTPQIEAYVAGEVAQAVAAVEQAAKTAAASREADHGRELRQAKRETAEAMRGAFDAHADLIDDRLTLQRLDAIASRPLPRWRAGRAARRRLTQITSILQETQS